jgi:hypothetical protein
LAWAQVEALARTKPEEAFEATRDARFITLPLRGEVVQRQWMNQLCDITIV